MAETTAPAKPGTLDDLMMAMDVVDTLRHREDLVRRELNDEGREAELIGRLKDIYRQQGIEVPDHVLAEGVKALQESRFVYTAPQAGWRRTLLTLWVRRRRVGMAAALALATLAGLYGTHYLAVARPRQIAEQTRQIEIGQTLPGLVRQRHAELVAISKDPEARRRADQLLAEGERAIVARDGAAMRSAAGALAQLGEEVAREYTLTIVSRPREPSGVWRNPPGNRGQNNYYLIVEPIMPDGRKLKLPVRNEENGVTETVDKYGVRVSQEVFDGVARDKRDDGIVQNNRFAVKRRGVLVLEQLMPAEGGSITKW